MHNGIMTAQWNGKLRNAKVFDRALTYVRFFRFPFMKVTTELLIGQDEITLESKLTD